ncbi:MAG: response regulator [Nitrospirae bacterium]|nr:response regulator [Nitrospirota bacterium]MBF0534401.1 response regulator [Nitrospirota bacterium]MBF0615618.1 response regulator [Nitrospirota bacterium]
MKCNVLIVEDEYIIAYDLKMSLMSLGYAVVGVANNAHDAVTFVKTTSVDIVLMDVILSGEFSGLDAAREIYHKYKIPVVYVTGCSGNDIFRSTIETEPFGYLIKPYTEKELFASIEIAKNKNEKI